MRKKWLCILAVTSTCFALPAAEFPKTQEAISNDPNIIDEITSNVGVKYGYIKTNTKPLNDIKNMLLEENDTLNMAVIDKVLTTLTCANQYSIKHNNILTIIDYSLPSSEKRLWVFDLSKLKLLFHTYVSHGIKSGALISNSFSNKYDSKASSIGVYKTENIYYGRDGLSLRLDGLDRGFNDNAFNRYVVMHGGWYVDEDFIKKYGRAGRSWGCPALPQNLTQPIINAIKDQSIFVIYYPSDNWFVTSKFLNCEIVPPLQRVSKQESPMNTTIIDNAPREEILFADVNKNSNHEESEPIVVISADNYIRIFSKNAPLERMLRRQINNSEYIALSNTEFKQIITDNDTNNVLNTIYFVIPVIKMVRGYYATEMHFVNLGKISKVLLNTSSSKQNEASKNHMVNFETRPSITLKQTNRFIRWLGL